MKAYYNEIDPLKAETIREAIRAGAIAPGDVDERSIADVQPSDLVGYTQCHFFAGGGFWSLALRQAGWPDDRPVWTGSCPCPSFSAAGKGRGFDDARHLWPEWFRLIRECRPATVFGEQVDAAIGHGWLDLVGLDLEGEGYAIAAAVLPAASVGAPHKRNRLFFCADTEHGRQQCEPVAGRGSVLAAMDGAGRAGTGSGPNPTDARRQAAGQHGGGLPLFAARPEQCGSAGQRADADGGQPSDGDVQRSGQHGLFAQDRGTGGGMHTESGGCEIERWSGDEGQARIGLAPPSEAGDDHNSFGNGRGTRRNDDSSDERPVIDTESLALDGTRCPDEPGRWHVGSPWNICTSDEGLRQLREQIAADARADSDATQRGQPVCGSAPGIAGHTAQPSQPKLSGNSEECGIGTRDGQSGSCDGQQIEVGGSGISLGDDTLGEGLEGHFGDVREWRGPGWLDPHEARSVAEAGATGGFWADCDWWYGRDGKYRPIGPGLQPLAHGSSARVGRLRMYGDAICVPAAAEFIHACREAKREYRELRG